MSRRARSTARLLTEYEAIADYRARRAEPARAGVAPGVWICRGTDSAAAVTLLVTGRSAAVIAYLLRGEGSVRRARPQALRSRDVDRRPRAGRYGCCESRAEARREYGRPVGGGQFIPNE